MADVFDLLIQAPAFYERIGWQSLPPCNGGSPKAPKPPPPPPAPVRADSATGEQAYSSADRRNGLRKTINPADPLAPKSALCSMGALGMGGEGVMLNNAPPPEMGYTGTSRVGKLVAPKLAAAQKMASPSMTMK